MKELRNHEFARIFDRELITELEAINPTTHEMEKIILWDPKKNPDAWNYILDVSSVYNNLSEIVEELKLSVDMIKNLNLYENQIQTESTGVLKYLAKNWILRFVSVYEVTLCLLNEVLELGYLDRSITKNNFENNKHISGNYKIEEIRKKMSKLIIQKINNTGGKKIENLNNKIKHEGDFPHETINELFWSEFLFNCGNFESGVDYEIEKGLVRSKLADEFKDLNQKMIKLVIDLLDYL
jgi:hypothetical protein